jgi:hypothetical protein
MVSYKLMLFPKREWSDIAEQQKKHVFALVSVLVSNLANTKLAILT